MEKPKDNEGIWVFGIPPDRMRKRVDIKSMIESYLQSRREGALIATFGKPAKYLAPYPCFRGWIFHTCFMGSSGNDSDTVVFFRRRMRRHITYYKRGNGLVCRGGDIYKSWNDLLTHIIPP